MTTLSFCQNDPQMGESFWQNNSLVTHIHFDLQPIMIFSPVANFGTHPLYEDMQYVHMVYLVVTMQLKIG